MSKVLVTESSLQGIAAAIRAKNGQQTTYKPGQMAAAIQALPGASTLISKSITQNGSYDPEDDSADGYSAVTVNVPNSYAAGDEGKVVSNGALVAQTARASEITANGTYDTTTNNEVTVNISSEGGGLELNFDFTQSMTDTVRGVTPLTASITQGASGAVFDTQRSYIRMRPRYSANTYTYEIDVGTLNISTSTHNRFIMGDDTHGLIYRSTGKWAFYSTSQGWEETSVTSKTYFNGTTVKVYIDQNGKWHIYRNGTLWWEPSGAQTLDTASVSNYTSFFTIGSNGGQGLQAGSTITGMRVY